jgi:poly(3-hydroxybutyrate) depolymerase
MDLDREAEAKGKKMRTCMRRFLLLGAPALMLVVLGASAGCDGTREPSAPMGASGAGSAGLAAGGPSGGSSGGGAASGATSGGAPRAGTAGAPAPDGGGIGGASGGSSPGEIAGSGGVATAGVGQGGSADPPEAYEPISFGTTLEPTAQIAASRKLAQSLASESAPTWRAKGDQHRTYRFAEANADVPYRVCVPTSWDGSSELPLVMFLHGASNDESSYLDQNGGQMVTLAQEHGYVLVSPLGHGGAYGTFLRLPADFSRPEEATKLLAMRTEQTEKTQELSEKDVINVLELVLNEYPIDRSKMFLTGHSMGSGGTWYLGAKYATYWAALAPMSGPFVLEKGYPWENLRSKPVLVTEGLGAATVAGSRAVHEWMKAQGFTVTYREVDADHAGMVPRVLPDVFAFFDRVR